MANNTKKKQKQQEAQAIPHTKITYAKNTDAESTQSNKLHAPRPVKKTEKPKALPRSSKK